MMLKRKIYYVKEKDLLAMLVASFMLYTSVSLIDEGKVKPLITGMKRLLVSIGKKDKIEARDIYKAFIERAGIKGEDIGRIRIFDNTTLVEVCEEAAEAVISALDKFVLKGVPARVFHTEEKR